MRLLLFPLACLFLIPDVAAEDLVLTKSVHCTFSCVEGAKLADVKMSASVGRVGYLGFDSESYYFVCISNPKDSPQTVVRVFSVKRKEAKLPDVVNLHYELTVSKEQEEMRQNAAPLFIEFSNWSDQKKLQRAFPVDLP